MFHGMYHCHKFGVNGNTADLAIMMTMKICDLESLLFKLDLEYSQVNLWFKYDFDGIKTYRAISMTNLEQMDRRTTLRT